MRALQPQATMRPTVKQMDVLSLSMHQVMLCTAVQVTSHLVSYWYTGAAQSNTHYCSTMPCCKRMDGLVIIAGLSICALHTCKCSRAGIRVSDGICVPYLCWMHF